MADVVALPPGPRLPALVQTLGFILRPLEFLERSRRRYGDVVSFKTVFDPGFVMVFSPEAVGEVFRAPPDRLRAGEANQLLGAVLGERSVLLLDGEEHLRERRLLLPPFHGARMKAYETVIEEATDRQIDSWPTGEPFALLPSMHALTLDVMMHAVFGVRDAHRRAELSTAIRAMLAPTSRRLGVLVLALSGGRWGQKGAMQRLREQRETVHRMLDAEIAERRADPDLEQRGDVLSSLLLARDEDGKGLADSELRDELVTLLVAGHETTANALAWAFDLILRSPHVRAEVERGDPAYLDATVKEVLRARPVIPGIGRVVRGGPYEIAGRLIPEGVEINPSITSIHRRADRYPRPADFAPERFLGPEAPDGKTWIPFGGGTRRCLGAAFALFEMRTVIARVLARTHLQPAGPDPEEAVRRGITVGPKTGTRVLRTAGAGSGVEGRRAAAPGPSRADIPAAAAPG